MKTQLQAQLLRHFSKKNQTGGFTLIELLVVIIIIGILSAIALPAFLNQANKARQSEGKTYVGSMNRAQQAYYLENNGFVTNTTNFDALGLGIPRTTADYKYEIVSNSANTNLVTNQAEPLAPDPAVKAYVGGVEQTEGTTLAVLCEQDSLATAFAPTTDIVTAGTATSPGPNCPSGFTPLGRQ